MLFIINILLAAVPSIALVIFFYFKDKRKHEPFRVIWKAFAFGFLSVIPAVIAELVLSSAFGHLEGLISAFVSAFIIAALTEEFLKFLTVRVFIYKEQAFDEVMDGIVYTVTAGLGFALFENMMYTTGPSFVLILRGVSSVPLHAMASGIMGYYIGIHKMKKEPGALARGIFYGVLIHGLYDFFLFAGAPYAIFVVPLLIAGWIFLIRLIRNALAIDTADNA